MIKPLVMFGCYLLLVGCSAPLMPAPPLKHYQFCIHAAFPENYLVCKEQS